MISALFATLTNVNFSAEDIETFTRRVHEETRRLVPDCSCCQNPCGHNDDYDMRKLWSAQEDIRSLKSLILFGVRGMAAYAHHAYVLGYEDEALSRFFAKALFAVGEDWGMEELLPLVLEVGEKNLACMALLDRANTETFGNPVPTQVPLTVEKGPFIVVSGHDLRDLKLLLEQTDGKGVNIYTHGEMLPAHGYPELKKHPQLKGNFGTAWQSQQKEFQNIPRRCFSPRTVSCRRRTATQTASTRPPSWATPACSTSGRTKISPRSSSMPSASAAIRKTRASPASTAAQRSRPALRQMRFFLLRRR